MYEILMYSFSIMGMRERVVRVIATVEEKSHDI